MEIRNPNSISDHQSIFQEGADLVAVEGKNCVGLWYTHTPDYQGKRTGTIGACDLEDSNQSSKLLWEATEFLIREQGCEVVIGPMNGNTWQKHRLILKSGDQKPFLLEPIEPSYFPDLFKNAGFDLVSRYSSSVIDLAQPQRNFANLGNRIADAGFTLRPFNLSKFDDEIRSIYELSIKSFADNFLYTDISFEHFSAMYQKVQPYLDPEFILLAELEGDLAGYVFCMPDPPTNECLIVKTLATDPDRRSIGLGTYLVAAVQGIARAKGYQEVIHALQFESNSSLRISQRFRAEPFRKYGLMIRTNSV